jgi:hypothetical protein
VTGFQQGHSAVVRLATVRYMREGAGFEVVSASIEGQPVLLAFEPDPHEHRRRLDHGVGAVRSRRLLHALWSLSHQVSWPAAGFDHLNAETLESDGAGFVEVNRDTFVRTYQPPGRVHAVGLHSSRLVDAVRRVGMFPPIFARYAIAARPCRTDEDAVVSAAALGIGAAVALPGELLVGSRPGSPEMGAPGVYRWWIAEVAYQRWRQASAH